MPGSSGSSETVPQPPAGTLLDLARLREFAIELAHRLTLTRIRAPWGVRSAHLARINRQLGVLSDVYQDVADDVHRGETISPSAEWLLDNYHLISGEARSLRRDLPPGYYRRLPRVVDPPDTTRIEVLAREIISHSDGRLDAERLQGFLLAFQTASPLTIGELWAWSSALKLTLVGYITDLAARVRDVRNAFMLADAYLTALDAPNRRTDADPGEPGQSGVHGAGAPARPRVRIPRWTACARRSMPGWRPGA